MRTHVWGCQSISQSDSCISQKSHMRLHSLYTCTSRDANAFPRIYSLNLYRPMVSEMVLPIWGCQCISQKNTTLRQEHASIQLYNKNTSEYLMTITWYECIKSSQHIILYITCACKARLETKGRSLAGACSSSLPECRSLHRDPCLQPFGVRKRLHTGLAASTSCSVSLLTHSSFLRHWGSLAAMTAA